MNKFNKDRNTIKKIQGKIINIHQENINLE